MARMLQALKNLEARSGKATGSGWLAHLAEQPGHRLPAAAPFTDLDDLAAVEVAERVPEVMQPVRRADAPAIAEVMLEPAIEVATLESGAARREPRPPAMGPCETRPPTRQPSGWERQVQRTLNDAARAAPLVQLADRLRRDAEQSASKLLLLVGVGEASATHEAALYAAALLARQHGERVLLIDADMARRSLTGGLDFCSSPGLAELLRGSAGLRDKCRETAIDGVSLLPAGLASDVKLSEATSRLGEILPDAATDYSLVLIDGGRTQDAAATSLARLADATYFVVQLGTAEASQAQAALRDFRAAGARVMGCIAS